MSARGARSRKAVAKDIEKKEKKAEKTSGKLPATVEPIRRPNDAFADWRPTPTREPGIPSRSVTVSSEASRNTSRSNSTNASGNRPRLNTIDSNESFDFKLHRPRTSLSGSTSLSDKSSNKGKEKTKYQAKGKDTNAPRGRGGGVPVKKPTVTSPTPPYPTRSETTASYVTPGQKTWQNFRVWEGGEAGIRPYAGFEYDEDMQHGDVLIFFKEEQISEDRPFPQIRCDLSVLESSGSTWLSNALLYGRIDDGEDEWALPGSPESSSSAYQFHGMGPGPTMSPNGNMSPIDRRNMPISMDEGRLQPPSAGNATRTGFHTPMNPQHGTQSPAPFHRNGQPLVRATHELWFTAPSHLRTPQAQRLHHVAVRNFLAMLHNKPIVGADLFEMLSTLQPEIQVMYDLDYDSHSRLTPQERSIQMITHYLASRKLDDIRNSIKLTLGILAWSEQDNVKWRQGYLESFAHLAGILSPQIEDLPDFKRLSIVTRRNLGIAAKTLQLHVLESEEKLATFDFADIWEPAGKAMGGPVYQSYTAFRQFLIDHYSKMYGAWPPNQGKSWLNRKVALQMQGDFGSLYDYLVNRDVSWDSREERPGKKWQMQDRATLDLLADRSELPLTDMLVTFDNRHGYLHIPHPYPLLPREVPGVKNPVKKSLFGGLKKQKNDTTQDAKAHLQLSIIFSDATNVEKLDASFKGSALIDAFERFELSAASNTSIPARDARLGRWILLYGVLQILSKLSVDIQGLKWTDDVRYFLCTELKRCPDWVTQSQAEQLEASQQRSWCWQRAWDPTPIVGAPVELDSSPVIIPLPTVPMPPEPRLDGATLLNNDIQRISEKIEGFNFNRQQVQNRDSEYIYDRRIENEKIKHEDFAKAKGMDMGYSPAMRDGMHSRLGRDASYRLTESDYTRPLVPTRSPLRSPPTSAGDGGNAGAGWREGEGRQYFPSPNQGWA